MLEIDKYSRVPIYEQMITGIENMIADGELKVNDVLPSIRSLSQELSVNPNTLQKAYSELERKGLCYTVPGSGRFVAEGAQEKVFGKKDNFMQQLKELLFELLRCQVKKSEVTNLVDSVFDGGKK